jgi:septum formation protein
MTLILGSTSPRRKEILSYFSLDFRIENPNFNEDEIIFRGDPAAYAMEIAKQKALHLQKKHPQDPILTADTVVYKNGKIFLKPTDLEQAHAMLRELSGSEHQVFTGVCVLKKDQLFIDACKTSVFFHELTDSQIHEYHKHFQPLDKAGGYAIQKGGSVIVKRIEGCYYNIMGLPLDLVRRLLLNIGIDLWNYLRFV